MAYFNSHGVAMPESATPAMTVYGTSAGGESLSAPVGPSAVSGEGGGDTLIGNSGDITFYIDHPHDVVQQAAGTSGTKTAIAYTWYKLPANVQNLISYGSFNYAAGNSLPNLIIVNGDQWVDGGAGDDVLVGGSGRATFEVRAGEGSDVIYGWHGGDHIRLLDTALSNITQIKSAMTQVGADVVLQIDATETLTVRNMTIAQFSAGDFMLPLDQSQLGALTFSDDFNTLNLYDPSTDTGMWQTNFGGNLKDTWAYTLVPNGEHQSYVTADFRGSGDHPLGYNPFSINNGVLSITAAPIPVADQQSAFYTQYYSGMINTFDTFEQKYGYFEIRAEFPSVAGVWPGLWMQTVPWKPNVEADIAEARGVEPYFHYVRAYGGEGNTQTLYDDTYMRDPTGFHTYGMLWTASTVSFYVDGIAVMSGPTPGTWTDPMALIANFAIGGWGGPVDDSHMPATMRIDYVRAYALADGSSIVDTSRPAPPAATVRLHGSPISSSASDAQLVVPNFDSGGAVTASNIIFSATAPNPGALPPGETFFVWASGGSVFGARSDGSQLAPATALLTGNLSQFQAGTWLTDHRVALSYLQTNNGVQNTWAMLFDPFTQTIVNRQQLGAASGNVHLVPTQNGGFALSWSSGSTIQGRAFDAHAYDQSGWFGALRPFSGDLLGINSAGELVSAVTGNTSVRQVYDVLTPTNTVPASLSLSPLMVSHPEGNAGLTNYSYTITRSWNFTGTTSVDWSVIGNAGQPANAVDFQGGVYPSGTVNFAIGETTKTISFNVLGDTQLEGDETFTVTLSNVNGAVLGQASVNGTIVNDDGGSALIPGRPDFNGDSYADIAWQNDNGQVAIWQMNGTAMTSGVGVAPNPGPAWHVKGTGDFNGDGKVDLLWQNTDGTPVIWFMNGTTFVSGGVASFNPGSAWHVIAAADFNGDSKADILWQNDNGTPAIWLMNGTTLQSGASLVNPGVSWHVIGAGDFNGDGKADILWQSASGQAAVWLMDGTSFVSGSAVGPSPGTSWHAKSAGDFNGDGKSDILWQNNDGTPVIWFMNGTSFVSGAVAGFNPGSAWHAVTANDFNADGKADIAWQNDNGTPAVWLMNGSSLLSGSSFSNPGTAWHILTAGS